MLEFCVEGGEGVIVLGLRSYVGRKIVEGMTGCFGGI